VFDLLATDTLILFDNLAQVVRVIATACPAADGGADRAERRARDRIRTILEALVAPSPQMTRLAVREVELADPAPAPPWQPGGYQEVVRRAKEHIFAGDVFQVVPSQRFEVSSAGAAPLDVYRMLRVTNPAPYMYLFEVPGATLAGASPEVLVRVEAGPPRITVRPIAGTRPRGATAELDAALEAELRADPKERAEHLMLIDLGRNDVGRVAEPGSVRLAESFVVERYSRVQHLVSEVTGLLRPGLDALDALCATFPAGTLSGAPKVRALELLDELEPADRGWFGGAVGYLAYDGSADFAICIRTAVLHGDTWRVQAGAGIVHDSDPDAEDRECRAKASAVLRAIALARSPEGVP
jgi:anthranilate synthase component 1